MPDPAKLRDSTEIRLPAASADAVRDDLESRFVLTFLYQDGECRIIGSPVEIKQASDYLARQGISLP